MSCFHSLQVAATNKIDLTESSKSPASIAQGKAVGWDLLVSGVVQATPDKLRSSYSVMSK